MGSSTPRAAGDQDSFLGIDHQVTPTQNQNA